MTPVPLHHQQAGRADAPVVLLGGSLGTSLAMWEPQIAGLAATHRVIAFDHRGHGESPVPAGPYTIDMLGGDVLALMDRLAITRAAYVGLSIGGMVGQWLAIHAPQRISSLVAICTTARMDSPQPWRERAATVRGARSTEPIADAVVARWFTPAWARRHSELVARHRAMIAGTDPEGYAGCCEAIAALDLADDLGGVRAPTLVLAGAQDEAIPAEHGRRIAAAIPGARFALLDPAAHVAGVERPDAVLELIHDHLEGMT